MSLEIAQERWTDELGHEAVALASAHFDEVDGNVEPKRKFNLDFGLMKLIQDADAIVILIARQEKKMVGYFTWQVSPDIESAGLTIAQMGAWYVKPNNPKAAILLFDKSIELLKSRKVDCIFPHHRVQGRGANIGNFFKRRGAKETQRTYSLWIGD